MITMRCHSMLAPKMCTNEPSIPSSGLTGEPRNFGVVPCHEPDERDEHDRRAQRGDHDDVHRAAAQRRVREALEDHAHDEHDRDRDDVAGDQAQSAPARRSPRPASPRSRCSAEGDERPLGEVDDPGGLVGEKEPDRGECRDGAFGQAAREQRREVSSRRPLARAWLSRRSSDHGALVVVVGATVVVGIVVTTVKGSAPGANVELLRDGLTAVGVELRDVGGVGQHLDGVRLVVGADARLAGSRGP